MTGKDKELLGIIQECLHIMESALAYDGVDEASYLSMKILEEGTAKIRVLRNQALKEIQDETKSTPI